ncbi:MAG: SWIM zinc finger family protein, partial [Actinomycetota bacterium]
QAAGVGITLTKGDHVVFNDLDWVPANHWQAEDRIHRIGRVGTAFVTYLYTPDTLDGFVADLLEQKARMVEIVERDSAVQASLIDQVVGMATAGPGGPQPDGETPMTTEPLPPTMGLLEETLALLEAFGGDAALRAQVGVEVREFPSSRDPKVVYRVELDNGIARCSCPGFQYGGNCKHARQTLREACPSPAQRPRGRRETRRSTPFHRPSGGRTLLALPVPTTPGTGGSSWATTRLGAPLAASRSPPQPLSPSASCRSVRPRAQAQHRRPRCSPHTCPVASS